MTEEWKPVFEFEDHYEVSNLGRVRNSRSGRVLTPKHAGTGYLQVCLKSTHYRYIHRLVAIAFVPNLHGYPHVNHLDGHKQNNLWTNLQWCTRSMNLKHAYETGLLDNTACKNPPRGVSHPRSVRVAQYCGCGHIYIEHISIAEAVRSTGLDYSTVHGAAHGRFKQAGGWRWKLVPQPTETSI